MTAKTKFMLWLGTALAGFAAAVLYTSITRQSFWVPAVLAVGGFTDFAFAFGDASWVATAVPLSIVSAVGVT